MSERRQPSSSDTAPPISTAAPRTRRHGLTPRRISSAAHQARLPRATIRAPVASPLSASASHPIPDAAAKIQSGRFGGWPIVIRPVFRFRNAQSAKAASLAMAALRRARAYSSSVAQGQPFGALSSGGSFVPRSPHASSICSCLSPVAFVRSAPEKSVRNR